MWVSSWKEYLGKTCNDSISYLVSISTLSFAVLTSILEICTCITILFHPFHA